MRKNGGQKFHALLTWRSEGTLEAQFGRELRRRDFVEQDIFAHMLPQKKMVRDITGAGTEIWLDTELWVGGPAFRELDGDARPEPPGNTSRTSKKVVWDFWVTNYNPNFWEYVFGDCEYTRFTNAEGKGLCPSSGAPSVARTKTIEEIWEALPSVYALA